MMMNIPPFFHELLGKHQQKSSLFIIALFVLISGVLLGILAYEEWRSLSPVKGLVTALLFLDISGGVIANLTKGTDIFYARHPKKRWIFIMIHIQPLILSWSLEIPMIYGMIIFVYTLISASFLNLIREFSGHPLIAGGLTAVGFLIVLYQSLSSSFIASTLLLFYVFKVLFSFSVFHHKGVFQHENQ
jgi:hypothetical protein